MENNVPLIDQKECDNSQKNQISSNAVNSINYDKHLNSDYNFENRDDRLNMLVNINGPVLSKIKINLVFEDNLEEVKTKKTNSTGDITPNISFSLTDNVIDQLPNENLHSQFMNLFSPLNANTETNYVQGQQKIKAYQQKERELLDKTNKAKINKKPFKNIAESISLMCIACDKYFPIPKKLKDKNKKFIIKQKDI